MAVLTPNFSAHPGLIIDEGVYEPLGDHTQDSVSSTTVVLTPPERATGILIQPIDYSLAFTIDGTDPSVTDGFILGAGGDPLYIPLGSDNVLSLLRVTSDVDIRYQWVRVGADV